MMNGAHAATGALVGGAVAYPAVAAAPPSVAVAGMALAVQLGAGAALLPDIDHDQSTITRSAGWITRALAETLQLLARATYRATRGGHDPSAASGEHRGLIHTPAFAVLVGALLAAGALLTPWVGIVTSYALSSAAIRSLRWHLPSTLLDKRGLGSTFAPPIVAAGIVAALYQLGTLTAAGPWIGLIVTAGMITHSLGDGATNSGIPFTWPLKRRCEPCREQQRSCPGARWSRQNVLPSPLRWSVGTRVGRAVETVLEVTCLAAVGALAAVAATDIAVGDLPQLLMQAPI